MKETWFLVMTRPLTFAAMPLTFQDAFFQRRIHGDIQNTFGQLRIDLNQFAAALNSNAQNLFMPDT
jgi:hypothetical protein